MLIGPRSGYLAQRRMKLLRRKEETTGKLDKDLLEQLLQPTVKTTDETTVMAHLVSKITQVLD